MRKPKKKRPRGKDVMVKDIPPNLHAAFKAYCHRRGICMRTRLLQLMRLDMHRKKVAELDKIMKDYNRDVRRDTN